MAFSAGKGRISVGKDLEAVLHKIEYWQQAPITKFRIMARQGQGAWHGVRWDGSALFLMPSHEFNRISDDEFGRLLEYVKSVPPVDRTPRTRVLYPMAHVLHLVGAPLVPAEKIDHAAQRNPQPAPGATLAYGEYVSAACQFCHGEDLGGQKVGGEPGAPPSPPIGPNSVVAHWTDAQFIQTMHTGVTPEGRKLDGKYMPWQAVGTLSDDELRGLLMALKKGKGA